MGDTQNEPFENLVAKLRRFSEEQRTGVAFLRPGGGKIVSIGFADGEKLRTWHGGVAASANFQSLVETLKPLRIVPKSDPLQ